MKFISDAFRDEHKRPYIGSTDFEDNREYKKRTTFSIPPKARWDYLEKNAKKEEIGVHETRLIASMISTGMTMKQALRQHKKYMSRFTHLTIKRDVWDKYIEKHSLEKTSFTKIISGIIKGDYPQDSKLVL